MGIITVLWEKWTEFRRDWVKITLAAVITPLLYLVTFGQNIRSAPDGSPYLSFLIPGLAAMATMTGSFGAVIQNMSVQRLYEKALDQVMVSPTPLWQFLLGQVIGGSLRGLYAGLLVFLISAPFGAGNVFAPAVLPVMLLNGMVFATLALVLSFQAKTYADAPRYTAYIITPMAFLCNTFFPTDTMPEGARQLIGALPLSRTCAMMRALAGGRPADLRGILLLAAYLFVLAALAVRFVYRKKNL